MLQPSEDMEALGLAMMDARSRASTEVSASAPLSYILRRFHALGGGAADGFDHIYFGFGLTAFWLGSAKLFLHSAKIGLGATGVGRDCTRVGPNRSHPLRSDKGYFVIDKS